MTKKSLNPCFKNLINTSIGFGNNHDIEFDFIQINALKLSNAMKNTNSKMISFILF